MSKVIKISDSTSLKLKELMNELEKTGCSSEEKFKARKISNLYLDGKAEINEIFSDRKTNNVNNITISTINDILKKLLMFRSFS